MVYQTRKQLEEFGDKVPEDVKKTVEGKINELEEAVKVDDVAKMKTAMESLQQEVTKIGEAMYGAGADPAAAAGAGGGAGGAGPGAAGAEQGKAGDKKKKGDGDDVIDAEFTDSK